MMQCRKEKRKEEMDDIHTLMSANKIHSRNVGYAMKV